MIRNKYHSLKFSFSISWSPYDIGQREIYKNNIRVAEVWMDDFKYLYYDRYRITLIFFTYNGQKYQPISEN